MEKIKPKIYLKIGILLFGISFILTNCQKDDSILTSENKSLEQSKFKVKTLNSKDLKSHQKVIQKISKLNLDRKQSLQQSNSQRIIYNSELGFSINTDYVKYLENTETGYHSYSFPITRDSLQTNNVENLLLALNNNNLYDAYIVEYGFTKEQYKTIDLATLNATTTRFTPIDFDISIFNSNDFSRTTTYECNETWSWSNGTPHNGQVHGADCNCTPDDQGLVLESINCVFVSSAGSGINSGSSSNGSSNGSGGSSSNDGNDNTEEENVDLNDGHGLDAAPAVEEDIIDNNNLCQEIDIFKNDDVFKQKMTILKSAAEQWSFEKCFTVYDDQTPNSDLSQTDNYDYGEYQGSINSPTATWAGNYNIRGIIHSHFLGHLSVLSPQDLMDMYNTVSNPQVLNSNTFFYGVVTNSGTAYILQIKDKAAFLNFGYKYFRNNGRFENFEINTFNKKFNIKPTNSNTDNEYGFVKMLSKLNAGLNIYKATDSTFSNYQKLAFINNQVTPTNCN